MVLGNYIEKLTKICLGDFLLSLGDFLTKTSGHPVGQFGWNIECHRWAFDTGTERNGKMNSVFVCLGLLELFLTK